jgi:adenine-specific DNA-methyltransferase
MAGNLMIHGDNVAALKALLPIYAGKVDCIFIDPPYNTGNEGWGYSDAVNSPMMREWLSKVVDRDDLLRHDKWLCMMWPRLRLLHELLSKRGSLWITLDDNEVHHARAILDEIFGEDCFVGEIVWQKRTSRENRAVLSPSFDHVLVYSRASRLVWKAYRNLLPLEPAENGDDEDAWDSVPFSAQGYRKNQHYDIVSPSGTVHRPPVGRSWGALESEFEQLKAADLIYWPRGGDGRPRVKQPANQRKGLVPTTLWFASEVGDTEDSKKEVLDIFTGEDFPLHAPKPRQLIQRIIEIATNDTSIILDSFAGSGTTGHATLVVNAKDGGNRRFILVECEEYADTITAERLRRVIRGYNFHGTRREELLRETITLRTLQRADALFERVAAVEDLERHRFDEIKRHVKDGVITVIGETKVAECTEGLPGGFSYCTLGPPLDLDELLAGTAMPSFESLGGWLFHTATGTALDPVKLNESAGFLGEGGGWAVSMIYKPDRLWLESPKAALTLDRVKAIVFARPDARHLVFAAVSYVPSRTLEGLGVTYVPLPFALFRVEQES